MKKLIMAIVLILFAKLGVAQDFKIKKIDIQTIDRQLSRVSTAEEFGEFKLIAFDIAKNYGNASELENTDCTVQIQNALDRHSVVLLPNYAIKINDTGLNLHSNQVLLFQSNTVLRLIPTAKGSYSILKLSKINNVKIFNANIEGDRYAHLGKEGQWGFGIGIKSSSNIFIYSPYIKATWGDGIYIGQTGYVPSTGIKIFNAVIDDVRRNGISITSADGVEIKDSFIANTNGNSPESALDIEPNSIKDVIKNITIKNLTSYNNKWAGILLVFEQFKSSISKNISITIDGHKDVGSKNAIAFHGYRNDRTSNNLKGKIKLTNINYFTNSDRFFFYKTNLSKLKICTDDLELENKFTEHKKK